MIKLKKLISLNRILWPALLFVVFSYSHNALTADEKAPTVLVMPFRINADNDLAYLSHQIATVLAGQLEKQGAITLTPKETEGSGSLQAPGERPQHVRAKAQSSGADQVVWGSFTLIGNDFSLDVQLMEVAADSTPKRFYAQGRNLENLVTVTNDLADQIGLKLFRRQLVSNVQIEGQQRIESDAIARVIKTKIGSVFRPAALSDDLRAIYAMGYFDDVRVEALTDGDGKRVVFHVKEKPTIRYVKLEGNSYIDEEDITENLTISTGAILNIYKIRSNIDQIASLYKEKNYHKVHVDYKVKQLDNNQADLTFIIDEGPKLYVTDIAFEGNKAFSGKALKKEMDLSEKGLFYWLTSSGDLDRVTLDQDIARLKAFYSNNGYINVRIGEPQVDIRDEGITITIKVDEGDQYTVGQVDVEGDLIVPKEELLQQLEVSVEEYLNRDKVRSDTLKLTDFYSDYGYAYADVSPAIDQDREKLVANITFNIKKGHQVYFEKILINGNTITRDKVIRRELHVHEQGLFSGKALKRSIRNLYRLDYFEDIKVDTIRGSSDDRMILKLDVTEKPTGQFSFGAGYSSEENVFLTGSVSKRNFLGRGQILNLSGQWGKRTTNFVLSFSEPHIMDTRFKGTVKAYNQNKEYDEYDRDSKGGGITFGYTIFDYTNLYWGYNLDQSDINIHDEDRDFVSDNIIELEGSNLTSSTNLSLVYDSRDRVFNTTEGSKHIVSFEYAGLGGDIGFNKYIGQTMWYFPLIKPVIGFANAKIGFVHINSDNKLLPDYEKFYLGGINSLRGFGYRGVSLTEINEEGVEVDIGGEKMVQFNFEVIFPIVAEAGVNGVLFYDTGNVYNRNIDLTDLRESAGVGIRWNSPFAPIRLEYGWILDRREGEKSGDWEFTLGGSF